MYELILINPNTNSSTTAMMVEIAQIEAGATAQIAGETAQWGVPLITNEEALGVAAHAVRERAAALSTRRMHGVIVAAFGDPGLDAARAVLGCPVTGLAEAAMKEAAVDSAGHPRRFSVVTTTPQLADSIVRRAGAYGLSAQCSGVQLTPEDPALLMADAERLVDALSEAGRRAVETDGAQALVIGGGPLAQAARALRPRFAVPVIEPIPAAVRLALKRAGIPARPD